MQSLCLYINYVCSYPNNISSINSLPVGVPITGKVPANKNSNRSKWNLTSIIQLENGETEDKCNDKKNTKGLNSKQINKNWKFQRIRIFSELLTFFKTQFYVLNFLRFDLSYYFFVSQCAYFRY